ncbi:MAG TPA: hypothetical protein VD908_04210 [Cytophagales bacterium]|nr:hypothetical protein [Cytophagales bacterium]
MHKRFLLLILISFTFFDTYGQKNGRDSVGSKSGAIIQEVKIFAEKDNIVSKLLRNFLIIERKSSPSEPQQYSDETFDDFEGKFIRKINIKVLDVFGASINNPDKREKGWLEKTGNRVHKNTEEWVIRQRLLFKRGDPLDPLEVSETERLLRQYKNTYDARIVAKRIPSSEDSVDLFVLVQDVWSITGGGALKLGPPSGKLELRDVNFWGLGNELSGQVLYNKPDSFPWHYSLEYTNYNILKTLAIGNVYYKNLPLALNYGIGLNKDFLSPTVRLAGGINFNWLEDKRFIYDQDSSIISSGYNNNQQDFWLGYACSMGAKQSEKNYHIAGRILNTNYTQFPAMDTFRISYQNSTLYLGSIGYTYRRFIKDNYIFGLGRTEDIPIGKTIMFTSGYEDGQYFKRPYIGARTAMSQYFNKIGYLSASLEWGSFRNNNRWQDEVVSAELLFYTKLISLDNWRWRNFFWNRVTYGYNTSPGKILNINQREGIRGFSGGYIYGNKKYVINYESVFYTPINILGFKTAFMLFGDFAFLGKNEDPLFKGKFYQAYGIGVRFRNEHLIFRTIQLTLGYYPNTSSTNQTTFEFFEESRTFYEFTNFQFPKPRPLEF